MNIKKLLGKRIQEIRKPGGLTQEKVAEIIGMEPASLSNIENGRFYPTSENLEKIINTLGVKPADLYSFEHLAPEQELIAEMNSAMQNDDKLTKLMYNFFKTVKKRNDFRHSFYLGVRRLELLTLSL